MKHVFSALFAVMAFHLCGANNTLQKSGCTQSCSWNEAGHWFGGVPVAAPPTGEGGALTGLDITGQMRIFR